MTKALSSQFQSHCFFLEKTIKLKSIVRLEEKASKTTFCNKIWRICFFFVLWKNSRSRGNKKLMETGVCSESFFTVEWEQKQNHIVIFSFQNVFWFLTDRETQSECSNKAVLSNHKACSRGSCIQEFCFSKVYITESNWILWLFSRLSLLQSRKVSSFRTNTQPDRQNFHHPLNILAPQYQDDTRQMFLSSLFYKTG